MSVLKVLVKLKLIIPLFVGAIVGVVVLVAVSPKVDADSCGSAVVGGSSVSPTFDGLGCDVGYFWGDDVGIYASGGDVLDPLKNETGVGSFESIISQALNCTANGGTINQNSNRNAIGAAFIVLGMLGYAPGTNPSTACTVYGTWEATVNHYNSLGQANFYNTSYGYQWNSFYMGEEATNEIELPEETPTATGKTNDDAYFHQSGTSYDPSITFSNSSGSVIYAIRIECGNPVSNGKTSHLTPYNPISWSLTGTTAASPSSLVTVGDNITFTSSITNGGSSTTSSFAYGPRYFYSSTSSPKPQTDGSYANENSGGIPNQSTTLDAGKSVSITQIVTVTDSNTYICGTVAFSPYDSSGDTNGRSSPVCVLINHPPAGSTIAKCTTDASGNNTYTFTYDFSDSDASSSNPIHAYLSSSVYTADDVSESLARSYVTADGQSGTNTESYSSWPTPGHAVMLRVTDIMPDGSHNVWTTIPQYVGRPGCPPTPTQICSDGGLHLADFKQSVPGTYNGLAVHIHVPSSTTYTRYPAKTTSYATPKDTSVFSSFSTLGGPQPDWQQVEYDVYTAYTVGGTQEHTNPITVVVGPCATLTCNGTTFSDEMGVGQTQSFTVSVKVANATTAPPTSNPVTDFHTTVSGPNSQSYPGWLWTMSSNIITSNPMSFTPSTPGTYTVAWSFGNADVSISCNSSAEAIGYHPYFQVLGGDIAAGAGFGATCTQDATAGIEGWNDDGSPDYNGAGAQFAALAESNIAHFVSGQSPSLVSPSNPSLAPSSLSFANTGSGVQIGSTGKYGGKFGSLPCQPDYAGNTQFDGAPAPPAWASGTTINTSGTYTASGPGNPNVYTYDIGGITLAPDTVITIKVEGDAYITGDIEYDDSGGAMDYPRLNLIATGSIYVAPNVTEMHGLYVAQGTITGPNDTNDSDVSPGSFASCAYYVNGVFKAHTTYGTCSQQLTVYGSVDAKQLLLTRSYSYLGAPSAQPAEKFVYGPEFWLHSPSSGASGGAGSGSGGASSAWDAVTSLPPVL